MQFSENGGELYGPLLNFYLREFWLDFVTPALSEWRRSERDARLASIALRELDSFAEHVLRYHHPEKRSVDTLREQLRTEEPAIGIVRDLHDTHKHGPLDRKTAVISNPQRPYKQFIGPFGTAPFGSMPLGTLTILLRIRDNDGKSHLVAEVIDRCVQYWRSYLVKAGLLLDSEANIEPPRRFGAAHYFGRSL